MCNHKKKVILGRTTAFFLLSFLLLNSYDLAERVDDTSINNQWRFYQADMVGAEGTSFDDSLWAVVDLPHTYNAFDSQDGGGNYYRGPAWYRKHITIPSGSSGQVYLFFEAVGKAADVYCNGNFVGRHEGAYAAFCFDITDYVYWGGADNLIAVRTDNSASLPVAPLSGDFNQYGGICRKVHLIITHPVHVTLLDYASPGVYLTQSNVSETSADLEIKALIRNADKVNQLVTIRATIYDANEIVTDNLQTTQIIPQGGTQIVTQTTQIGNPHFWNGPTDPYLYKVVTEVEVGGSVVDSVEQPLGFRYFSVDANNGFFLNGQYLDLHGVAMHEDRKDKGRAISDADREEDMALTAEMGCNWIRLSHYQHAEKIYDLADEKGIVLWTEVPLINKIDSSVAFADNAKNQLRELIRQNYNHPSVCFWGMFNEIKLSSGPDPVPLMQELNTLAHQEDSTRLTTSAVYASDSDPVSYITDVVAFNRYFGWYGSTPQGFAPWIDGVHAGSHSGDEVGMSEYGAGSNAFQHEVPPVQPGPYDAWHPEEYQSYFHQVYWNAMALRPFLWCKTIWNGFDFAVDGRNEGSQPGLNDKGMVTRDRTVKKDAFYWYKANWTTEPMVHITSSRFTPRYTCPEYVEVYSNCEAVELFVNGVSMGTQTGNDHVFQWTGGIVLRLGSNEIRAVGVSDGNEYTDVCNWEFVIVNNFPISSVSASAWESANPPQNAIDGNPATRWAANGNQWIRFDLGFVQTVEKVGVSFYNSNSRVYTFNIETSNDDINWTPVLIGAQSSGTTAGIEEFDISDVSTRYIRIYGYGSTANTWNSYYEVEFYGNLTQDCAFMRSLNCGYPSDFSGAGGQPDCHVNNLDLSFFAAQWLDDYRQIISPINPGTANLEAYWPLDNDFTDAAANGYNGIPIGNPSFINPGHAGQSVHFDSASAIDCQNSSNLDLTGGATVLAWIKSSSVTHAWASVVSKGVYAWRLVRNNTGNTMCFHFNPADGGTEYQANGSTPVLDNEWHHLAGIYNGSEVRLYVDGHLDAAASAPGALRTSTDRVYIGSRIGRIADRSWGGQIDEVRIYNTALSEDNIIYLAEGEPYEMIPDSPRPTDLVTDGLINLNDLAVFAGEWLLCNDPQDPLCAF